MAEFLTGKKLDDKLTDIIWNAKKELIILSPFIRLDDYCKTIFNRLKNSPELKIIIVFGKNEGETQRSLTPTDLDLFKEFSNIAIMYCKNLHAKYYANENEALLTSLNLLDKSMTENVEYGICFQNSKLNLNKLYTDSVSYTKRVIVDNPCVFMKRPIFKKTNLGLSKKYLESKILHNNTDALYNNRNFEKKFYNDFEGELLETYHKPLREEFIPEVKQTEKKQYFNNNRNQPIESGYCIRTGIKIPFDVKRPFCLNAYLSWVTHKDWTYRENYCHKTGRESKGKTSMLKPILE